jgi:hypothetical protein
VKPLTILALAVALFFGCKPDAPVVNTEEFFQRIVEKEVMPKMVGARKLLDFKAERSPQTEAIYTLTLTVEGVNKFNGPVRENFTVLATSSLASGWQLGIPQGSGQTVADQISR